VFKLLLRLQLTFPRLATMVVLGALFVLVAAAIAAGRRGSALRNATNFVSNVGFVVLVPVASLVFSSSSLGDTVDDQTLVYLWLRPIARWRLTLASMASSMVIVWPLVIVPVVLGARLAGGNGELLRATAVATTVGVFAYVGIFGALGLRVRAALLWGLLYVFIWEGFVAGASDTAARLAIRAYLRSVLADATGVELRLGAIDMPWGWLVPLVVGGAGAGLTTWWLHRRDVP
jgi:ABC-2 type transport system permease protein